MNTNDKEFKFKYRISWPSSVGTGNFYWIELNGEHQIWFAPDTDCGTGPDNPGNMILLNDKSVDENTVTSLIERVVDSKIQEQLNEFKTEILEGLQQYVTREEFEDFVPELTDSDYERIAEKVNDKMLTWEVI